MSTQRIPILGERPEMASRLSSEGNLLVIAGAFVFVNTLALSITRAEVRIQDWLTFAVWVMCAVIGHLLLERRLPRRDPILFPLAMFLSGWGLVLIGRLAPIFADRQTIWLAISLVGLLAGALIPNGLRWLRSYRYTLLVVGLSLLVSTIVLGKNPSGAPGAPELWLGIGSIYFQPSEPLKIILVAFLASYLGEHYPALRAEGLDTSRVGRLAISPRILGPILLMWSVSVVILIWQRDLGTAILFFGVFLVLLYVASGYTLILFGGTLLIILAGVAAYYAFDVVRLRVDIWLNPWPEAEGRAYQIVQSLLAFASGGVFGQGIAQGQPTFIPVVHSDFVFSAAAEEWGLLGVITIICSIAILVMRGFRIAIAQRGRPFHTLMAVGLSATVAVQSLFIMCGVLKLVPLTGVTLPYMSYGGSSLLVNFVIVGLLLRLSTGEN
jgi:cell division protein FtsW (lipid II flippase)